MKKINKLVVVDKECAFRRLIPLELSSSLIDASFKTNCIQYIDLFINQFWRNRMTLVAMARLYAKNIFKNLPDLPSSDEIRFGTIDEPIVVLGAGASLEDDIETIKKIVDDVFIICVDTALTYVLKQNIRVDLCIVVEPQVVNQYAFIYAKNANIPLFADLCSYSSTRKILAGRFSFFLSYYAQIGFLDNVLACSNVPSYTPLGSVGLVAIETALRLRYGDTPIFFTGLDFSYELGKTHASETPAHIRRITTATRLRPAHHIDKIEMRVKFDCEVENETDQGTDVPMGNKGKNVLYTNPSLENYARMFDERYASEKALFNVSNTGILQKIKKISVTDMCTIIDKHKIEKINANKTDMTKKEKQHPFFTPSKDVQETRKKEVEKFLNNEKKALEELLQKLNELDSKMLTEGTIDTQAQDEIFALLKGREYLYIHFPDAYKKPVLEASFVARLRESIRSVTARSAFSFE